MAVINVFDEKATKEIIDLRVASTKDLLRERANTLAKIYNDSIQNGVFSPEVEITGKDGNVKAVSVREIMDQSVNEYTAIAREECFNALKATDDPMLEAVKVLEFATIKVVDKKEEIEVNGGKVKIPVVKIDDTTKFIDPLKLHKFVGGSGIGKDEKWMYMIEKLNFLMTARVCKELNTDPKELNDSYAMKDISKSIDLGKSVTSNTNLLKSLQKVVNAMIGDEYHALSHDVNFLNRVYCRKGKKALSVVCANHKYMRQYVMEICHRIVMNEKGYVTEFKTVKN